MHFNDEMRFTNFKNLSPLTNKMKVLTFNYLKLITHCVNLNMKKLACLFFICVAFIAKAQEVNYTTQDITINAFVDGTLLLPAHVNKPNLAIIISDFGAKDRNGNEDFSKNNALKKLAEQLTANDIATFRYDKRIVKQIRKGRVDKTTSFDDFITDATSVLNYFKDLNQFSKIYIIGHGQGSLVGMVAAKEGADGFISLAGSGKSIDEVIIEQVEGMDPTLVEPTKKVFRNLKDGKATSDYPPAMASVFNAEVQPFIMNWMQYHPEDIIKTLDIPTLIINGTKDLQVNVEEAKKLNAAAKDSKLEIIEKMNHVLFIIEGDNLENSKSYNESFRKIAPKLVEVITSFIKQ